MSLSPKFPGAGVTPLYWQMAADDAPSPWKSSIPRGGTGLSIMNG